MEALDLTVYLNTDGSLMAYNKDNTLNLIFTSLTSWESVREIYSLTCTPSARRKSLPKEKNLRYVKYYFRNTETEEKLAISNSHLTTIINQLK